MSDLTTIHAFTGTNYELLVSEFVSGANFFGSEGWASMRSSSSRPPLGRGAPRVRSFLPSNLPWTNPSLLSTLSPSGKALAAVKKFMGRWEAGLVSDKLLSGTQLDDHLERTRVDVFHNGKEEDEENWGLLTADWMPPFWCATCSW